MPVNAASAAAYQSWWLWVIIHRSALTSGMSTALLTAMTQTPGGIRQWASRPFGPGATTQTRSGRRTPEARTSGSRGILLLTIVELAAEEARTAIGEAVEARDDDQPLVGVGGQHGVQPGPVVDGQERQLADVVGVGRDLDLPPVVRRRRGLGAQDEGGLPPRQDETADPFGLGVRIHPGAEERRDVDRPPVPPISIRLLGCHARSPVRDGGRTRGRSAPGARCRRGT